jgi:hypothetical protein
VLLEAADELIIVDWNPNVYTLFFSGALVQVISCTTFGVWCTIMYSI